MITNHFPIDIFHDIGQLATGALLLNVSPSARSHAAGRNGIVEEFPNRIREF
jgi:hypothetical protein